MPFEALVALSSVAEKLSGLAGRFQTYDRDRRDRIATYFGQISDCLGAIGAELSQEGAVRGGTLSRCSELHAYADRFASVVGGAIPPADLGRLSADLGLACQQRALASSLATDSRAERDAALDQLATVAGRFRGLANSVRASA